MFTTRTKKCSSSPSLVLIMCMWHNKSELKNINSRLVSMFTGLLQKTNIKALFALRVKMTLMKVKLRVISKVDYSVNEHFLILLWRSPVDCSEL